MMFSLVEQEPSIGYLYACLPYILDYVYQFSLLVVTSRWSYLQANGGVHLHGVQKVLGLALEIAY